MTDQHPAGAATDRSPEPPGASVASERPIDARLAHVHLRTGAHGLARAELESLAGAGTLDEAALVDLAEVRWRTGDLAGAGDAAQAFLATGRDDAIALAIAAEAAMALGRPGEARRLATRALAATDRPIDDLFAGIARSPIWPSDARRGEPAAELFPHPARGGSAGRPRAATADGGAVAGRTAGVAAAAGAPVAGGAAGAGAAGSSATPSGDARRPAPWATSMAAAGIAGEAARTAPAAPGPGREPGPAAAALPGAVRSRDGVPAGAADQAADDAAAAGPAPEAGLWDDQQIPVVGASLPDPVAELAAARAAIAAGDHGGAAVHLALVLRLEPTMAPAVVDAAGHHRDPALLLVRGDALRIAGHEAEARREYAAAARAVATAARGEPPE